MQPLGICISPAEVVPYAPLNCLSASATEVQGVRSAAVLGLRLLLHINEESEV